MEFRYYQDVQKFAEKAEPVLSKGEDVYSLFFGVLQAIKAGRYDNPFMATIEEEGQVLALFQMTPPHPLNLIFTDNNRLEECMDLLIRNLLELEIELNSIISLKPWAYLFSEKWKVNTGKTHQLMMDQGLYRLDKINETLEHSPGSWRFADTEDCPLIEKWFNLFEEDAGLPQTVGEDVKKRVASFVAEQEVFLWEHEGNVVSMMKKSRPTDHGVTVSLVFTPKKERKKGYARTMVAAGTNELLKKYDFCMLYTDLMNPTANKIYQEVGYKRIADSVQLGFSMK
ncbi:GNAT family N-acetyltransferase [Sporosarcina sp. ANT_H38]|uniref:GNAT family N-acetyltransferase n=1 Tax=Sporosarcina sp. ANT_H38 TaxID=2597358 RepID=UPI0011F1C59C|nr:GNAT family N-acetyltransferase [Sporosarcina sp. ANT_H38]KAA0965018.1 GNAT family N-acetyltransferase [Sporosarcina sp. ANT_H38]